jgi:hypothetical protein
MGKSKFVNPWVSGWVAKLVFYVLRAAINQSKVFVN